MASDEEMYNTVSIKTPELFKLIRDEIHNILTKISKDFSISLEDLNDKCSDEISKIGIKMGMKRRNRRNLPKELQCMGRKIDGQQCTRSKRSGEDYCLSHMKRLPHGRIDDPEFTGKEKGKRGRKKKEIQYNTDEYLPVHLELINGKQYLIDDSDNVFSYNLETPTFLGKRNQIEV